MATSSEPGRCVLGSWCCERRSGKFGGQATASRPVVSRMRGPVKSPLQLPNNADPLPFCGAYVFLFESLGGQQVRGQHSEVFWRRESSHPRACGARTGPKGGAGPADAGSTPAAAMLHAARSGRFYVPNAPADISDIVPSGLPVSACDANMSIQRRWANGTAGLHGGGRGSGVREGRCLGDPHLASPAGAKE
ncbi:hypothetical protein P154DRAFT_341931 [Amniculicola lignicola CBS 123094]|uniref:Uncharacterized protein n=1 Tax=Amniculicola lignicola CBS 123094 TaxID=1392246 RepID=A0A6A5WDB7_9PLEO|nr:hypothetical protein P154DRAFT_341931 [Amniculicola lignicola CBS 123094]